MDTVKTVKRIACWAIAILIPLAAAFVYIFRLIYGKGKTDVVSKIETSANDKIEKTRNEIASESAEALAKRANEWVRKWGSK
jgi:hypothetical protein